jgi:multidrug efflux pump
MMCSKLMRPAHGPIYRWTEPIFNGMTNGLPLDPQGALKIPLVFLTIGAVVSFAAVNLFQAIPKEFAPVEDRGIIIIPISSPEGASLDYTRERVKEVERAVKALEERGLARPS